jgi:hypothetical protein
VWGRLGAGAKRCVVGSEWPSFTESLSEQDKAFGDLVYSLQSEFSRSVFN